MLEHPEEEIEIGMKIVKTFKDALSRQAHEAVRIDRLEASELLNSKNEFNHPPLARITVERNKKSKPKNFSSVAQFQKT